MRDIFSSSWQIGDDIKTLKKLCQSNIVQIKDVKFEDQNIKFPFSYNYEEGVKTLSFEVDVGDEKNQFLEICSEGEYTVYNMQKAIGSIDFNHNKIYLDRFLNQTIKLNCIIDRDWQSYIKNQRFNNKKYSLPTIFGIKKYTLNIKNYKVALLLEEVLDYLEQNKLDEDLEFLLESLNKINFQDKDIHNIFSKVSNVLKIAIQKIKSIENNLDVLFLGNSHLDLLFKWSEKQTISKNERTNSNFYSNYLFDSSKKTIFSQSYLLKYVKQFYPYQIDQYKEMIENNSLNIISDALTEYDTNIPNSMSIINNIKRGKELVLEVFNTSSNTAFLPDTFGYVANLPSIYRQFGIKYFITTKLLWNDTNVFPHTAFIWKDNQNSVISYKTQRGYGGSVSLYELCKLNKESSVDKLLYLYGMGDGGGGPNIEDFLKIDVLEENFSFINILDENIEDFMESVNKNLEVVEDELYLEKHRGVYTTANKIKSIIREMETLYNNISLENYKQNLTINTKEIEEFISYLSFHDTISGTMIQEAFNDIYKKYDYIKNKYYKLFKNDKNNLEMAGLISKKNIHDILDVDPKLRVYNDRSGYFDSWDISKTIFNQEIDDISSCIDYEIKFDINSQNDYEINVDINEVQQQKLVKLQIFNNYLSKYIYSDIGFGVVRRELNNNKLNKAKFEFPHNSFICFEYEGNYIGVINLDKYGSSFNKEYEISLLKTGVFPNAHSEVFPQKTKIIVTVCKSIKQLRQKANFYNNKNTLDIPSLKNSDVSVESCNKSGQTLEIYLLNNNFSKDIDIEYKNKKYKIAKNSYVKIKE